MLGIWGSGCGSEVAFRRKTLALGSTRIRSCTCRSKRNWKPIPRQTTDQTQICLRWVLCWLCKTHDPEEVL